MEPEGGGPPELTWLGDGQWLEASFACLGDVGTMRVLQPTLRVRHADRDGNLQARLCLQCSCWATHDIIGS